MARVGFREITRKRKKDAKKDAARKLASLDAGGEKKKGKQIEYKDTYEEFVHWSVLTVKEKEALKEPKTQRDFAKKFEIHENTVLDWKKREDYPKLRGDALRAKLAMETPEVLEDMRRRIKKYGSAFEVDLWLAYVEQWDRKQVIEMKQPVQFGIGDIRQLMANLPKEKQKMYYRTLARLIADAKEAEQNVRTGKQSTKKPDRESD